AKLHLAACASPDRTFCHATLAKEPARAQRSIISSQYLSFSSIQVVPHPVARVQVRGIGRRSLQVNLLGPTLSQKRFHMAFIPLLSNWGKSLEVVHHG